MTQATRQELKQRLDIVKAQSERLWCQLKVAESELKASGLADKVDEAREKWSEAYQQVEALEFTLKMEGGQ